MFDVCFYPLMRIAENEQFSDGQRKHPTSNIEPDEQGKHQRPTSSPMNKENIEHPTNYGAFP